MFRPCKLILRPSKKTDPRFVETETLVASWVNLCRAETECDGTRKRTSGEVKGKKANGRSSQQSCTVSDTVYPALLPLMPTPRLPAAD